MKIMKSPLIYLVSVLLLASCARPVASFMMDKEEAFAPTKIEFKNTSKKATSYLWDFGDGTTSTEANPNHKYSLSGKYKIKLIAKKGNKESIVEKELNVNAPENCLVEMETTAGTITIRLYDNTPKHRDNFLKLAVEGFYNGLLFHRVISNFMIQGGDPDSKDAEPGKRLGMGGPGYQVPAEFNTENFHVKGALAAARMGDAANPEKKSSGSQFYIVHGKPVSKQELGIMESRKGIVYPDDVKETYLKDGGVPFLDMEYTVYGIVEKGMDIIDTIAKTQTDGADRPTSDVKIVKINVVQ